MSARDAPSIVVALDFPGLDPALAMARRLDPRRCRVKIGKELFTRAGPQAVRDLAALGFDVFLDLKYHDIPNTILGACRAAAELGVWMLNVHASGGRRMMETARAAIEGAGGRRPLLVAVTVLTSLEAPDLAEVGLDATPAEQAARLARLAEASGLDGVVCSAADLANLAAVVGPDFLRVTPGVRPADSERADQRRIATPREAIVAGAHYLVIGRPITGAPDPMVALTAIEAEIGNALTPGS